MRELCERNAPAAGMPEDDTMSTATARHVITSWPGDPLGRLRLGCPAGCGLRAQLAASGGSILGAGHRWARRTPITFVTLASRTTPCTNREAGASPPQLAPGTCAVGGARVEVMADV